MSIKTQLESDLLTALKNKEERLSILRMLKAAMQNAVVEKRGRVGSVEADLDDKEILDVIRRQAKQLKDAMADFAKGGRLDLVEQSQKELKVLEAYLPAQLSVEVLEKAVSETIQEMGALGPEAAGKVMGAVMKKLAGQADGVTVRGIVIKQLGG